MLRLQGLGRNVGTELRATELIAPYIRRMMLERFDPERIAHRVLRTACGWNHLVQTLPEQIQATFERLRSGQFGVDFRVRDVHGTIDRLVDGLVASASLLAAAQLIGRKAGPTIGGISIAGLAVVGVGARTPAWSNQTTGTKELRRASAPRGLRSPLPLRPNAKVD